jgi:hypothetical protein
VVSPPLGASQRAPSTVPGAGGELDGSRTARPNPERLPARFPVPPDAPF